jgi:hypothetical protein
MSPMLNPLPACPERLTATVSPITTNPVRVRMFIPKRMSLVSIAFLSRSEFGTLTEGGGPLLCRLARCQAQAGQVELAVLGVAVRQIAWHDLRGNGAQPGDDSTGFVESAHMGIARGKSTV